ncbi:MAG: ABC transporter substrate-binding protein, partial [Dehalococcoidia bacterium]|nr:ABC transporter substrate-binding protein [Dehalococcoidia bacterium]
MSQDGSYWRRTLEKRLSRRRALSLAATAGAGTAGLALLGCGSDGGEGGGGGKKPAEIKIQRAVDVLKDETKDAIPGGVLRDSTTANITGTLDPMISTSFTTQSIAATTYEVLLRSKSRPERKDWNKAELGPRLVESWEMSEDGTTFTFRMRPNVRFHDVAPVNGRVMDIEDWRLSLERFLAVSPFKAGLVEVLDKATFPDSRTMVLKMKYPYGPLLWLLTSGSAT